MKVDERFRKFESVKQLKAEAIRLNKLLSM